jgi:hypothetical protein
MAQMRFFFFFFHANWSFFFIKKRSISAVFQIFETEVGTKICFLLLNFERNDCFARNFLKKLRREAFFFFFFFFSPFRQRLFLLFFSLAEFFRPIFILTSKN